MQYPPGASHQKIAVATLFLAMLLWSSSFIALKIAFRAYDPYVVIFGRMLVASLCFLAIGKRATHAFAYRRGDYKLILFMVLSEPCLYFIFEAKAVENTTASQAGMIAGILPILVMVAAALILKEKVGPKSYIGSIIALIGVCWLTLASTPTENAPNPILGNFLEFLAMVCAAGYTIALKSLTNRYSPFFLTAMQAFAGCLFFLPLLFFPSTQLPQSFQPGPALAILYLGAVITLGAYGLYNYSLKHLPANRAASFVNLIPLFSVLLGWLILGEAFNTHQCIAAIVVLAGVGLTQYMSPNDDRG